MLRRSAPLKADPKKTEAWQRRSRTSGLRSTGGVAKTSRKRRKSIAERKVAVIVDGPREPVRGEDHAFRKWVASLTCAVELGREKTGVEPAHLHCKRRFGDWVEQPDTGELRGNIMPLSHTEHAEQHQRGIDTYATSRGLDLEQLCALIGQAYRDGWTAFALSTAARVANGYQHIDLSNPRIDPRMECP